MAPDSGKPGNSIRSDIDNPRLYCSKSRHRALWQSTDIHVDRERRGWHENEDNSSYRGGKNHLATSWVKVIILKSGGIILRSPGLPQTSGAGPVALIKTIFSSNTHSGDA